MQMIGKFSPLSYDLMVYKNKFSMLVHEKLKWVPTHNSTESSLFTLKIGSTECFGLKIAKNRIFSYFMTQ